MLSQKITLFLTRISIGWLFFYAGITRILDPSWSAAEYIAQAQTFPGFYAWLASPAVIGLVNFLNEWGLTLIGLALIVGIFVRWVSWTGMLMMLLYYFPIFSFPYAGDHSYLVDEHVIYILVLTLLIVFDAGKQWGFDGLRR